MTNEQRESVLENATVRIYHRRPVEHNDSGSAAGLFTRQEMKKWGRKTFPEGGNNAGQVDTC